MDTTETYIKMSEKAWVFFKLEWGWVEGDWFVWDNGQEASVYTGDMQELVSLGEFALPRQDELQDMVERKDCLTLVKHFELFCNTSEQLEGFSWEEKTKYICQFTSMEQLWLAFVMKDNGKVWDSEKQEWVKE